MADPVLHVLAGPDGAGKTTFAERVLSPVTHLRFINADLIAVDRWPDAVGQHGYAAAKLAAAEREELMGQRVSFMTETVFSHPSKVELLRQAKRAGYRVTLHIVLIPAELAVARMGSRVQHGGHAVPEDKILERYVRLWAHVAEAIEVADNALVYDNSRAASPFRLVATYVDERQAGSVNWPTWSPAELRRIGTST